MHLLTLEAGFIGPGGGFSISYIHPSDEVLICYACDSIRVEMTKALVLEVERTTGRGEHDNGWL